MKKIIFFHFLVSTCFKKQRFSIFLHKYGTKQKKIRTLLRTAHVQNFRQLELELLKIFVFLKKDIDFGK